MLTVLLATLLLGWSDALAEARLKITSDRPVVVVVNMVPHPVGDSGQVEVQIREGREGRQNVRIRNLLGQDVWSGHLDVPGFTEVVARWEGRELKVTSSRRIGNPPRRSTLPPGSRPGSQDLKRLALEASDNTQAELTEAEFLVQEATRVREEEERPIAVPADPGGSNKPEPGIPSKVKLVNRTTSWANVYLDGERHEFRGQTELELELSSGPHPIEVKDFQDKEDWGRGTLWVYPDVVVELHFSKHEPPDALNKREAWHPAPQ